MIHLLFFFERKQMEEQPTHVPKEPVVSSEVRQKGIIRTLFDEIIVENLNDIKEHFIGEVVVPATLDWLYDLASSFVNDIFKTGGGGRSSGSTLPAAYRTGNTPYSNYYRSSRKQSDPKPDGKLNSYKDIGYKTRGDAEKVLFSLRENAEHYQITTVSDFLDFSNAPAYMYSSWTVSSMGWTLPMLDRVPTYRGGDGRYYLDLPNPVQIDRD